MIRWWILLEGILGYGFFERKIYLLRDNFTFERTDLDGKREKVLLEDPALGQSLFQKNKFYQIKIFPGEVFSGDIILFLGENGELLGNRLPYRFVEKGVLGLEFHQKSKRVLFWTEKAIGILDFSKDRTLEGNAFEAAPKLIWILRERDQIKQAFLVYEASHILFRE